MKKALALFILLSFLSNYTLAAEIMPVLDGQNYINDLKRVTLSKNDLRNQYEIAMDKFRQSNVKSSYNDFKLIIDNGRPNDFLYMQLSKQMASIGFFNLSELAMSKINDNDLTHLLEEDVKNYYYPSYKLNHKDQMYLAEIYSNIMYNNQSAEATTELKKQINLLTESDYANYLVACGSMKSGDIEQAKTSIDTALDKNPKNINYKRLKSEILSLSKKPQDGLKILKEIEQTPMNTATFDNEVISSKHYILYKTSKNDYLKKYYLAYYYYDENELNKSLRVLQTAISSKKNRNKDVFALSAKVYYGLKEYEKAQDYALKTLVLDKSNIMALEVLGDIAYRNNDYKKAQEYYKKASVKDSTHTNSVKLAKTYQNLNETKKAKEVYSKVLRVSSKSYQAYYEMGLLEKDRETTYIKKALSINPSFKDGWIDLARIEIEHDDYDKAGSYLAVVKMLGQDDYRYYYYLGLVMKNKGLTEEANKNFKRSQNLNPNFDLANEELSL